MDVLQASEDTETILHSFLLLNWFSVYAWERKECSALVQGSVFSLSDFIILSVWTMLALSGVTVQLRRERSEVPFPPHPYLTWKRERERRSTNVLDPSHHIPPLRERIHNKLLHIKEFFQKEQPAGERTPLLL